MSTERPVTLVAVSYQLPADLAKKLRVMAATRGTGHSAASITREVMTSFLESTRVDGRRVKP